MESFELSNYQKVILNYVKNEKGNLLVNAKAGSGKTSTLLLIANEIIKQNKKCLFLAFNKSIVNELSQKIEDPNCNVKTVHSLGLSFIKSYLYRKHNVNYVLKTDANKNKPIIDEYFNEYCKQDFIVANMELSKEELDDLIYNVKRELNNLVDFCRLYNVNYHDSSQVISLACTWCFELKNYKDIGMKNFPMIIESAINKIKELFENPIIENGLPTYEIDFTDMVYFPVYYEMNVPYTQREYMDYVLVDETQDLSVLSQMFLRRVTNGKTRYICVGDKNQSIYAFARS